MFTIFSWHRLGLIALAAGLLGLLFTPPDITHAQETPAKAGGGLPGEEEEANATPRKPKKIEVEDPETESESELPKLPNSSSSPTPSKGPNAPGSSGGNTLPKGNNPPSTPNTPNSSETGADSEPPAPEATSGVYVAKLDDLARAATTARHPQLREFYLRNVFAYDRLYFINGRSIRITPVPLLWGVDRFPAQFGYAPLDDSNNAGEVDTLNRRQVSRIDSFEKIVLEEAQKLTAPIVPRPKDAPQIADAIAAAERALTALMFFHDAARDAGKRRGKSWDLVKTTIYDRLTETRVARLKQAATDANWALMRELSQRYMELYKSNPKALELVLAARLLEAEVLVKSDKVADLERGREILTQYETRFPTSPNETAKKVRQALADRAKNFLADAARTMPTNPSEARNLLKTVEAIDPDNEATRQIQNQLRTGYPVLIVGTKRLPYYMSPALARHDSEHWATELLFEGLFEAIPDEQDGVRYRLGLAAERATVGAGFRDLALVRGADWGPNRGFFDATDVAGTMRLMRQRPDNTLAQILPWFEDPGFDPGDPSRVRMRFKLGHPDPRSLLTFKIHPAQWLLQSNKMINDPDFAKKPFGTGPYRLDPKWVPPANESTLKDVVFEANPSYGRRSGKLGLPFIKEIRFTDVSQMPEPANDFRGDRLHILADVPSAELSKYTANNNLNGRVRVITPNINRRIHMLAINHRRAALQSVDLRRGLSHAIDRERILNEVFRGSVPDVHKPLKGPFPVASWATPKTGTSALYNRDLAASKFKDFYRSPLNTAQLNLIYPSDDPQVKTACERMKSMIESCTATEDRKLLIVLEPLPPSELRRRVETEHSYDLAYMTHDYRDDWYPLALGALLDQDASTPGGRNFLGFPAKGGIPAPEDDRLLRLLDETRFHRDPAKLEQLAHLIHHQFKESVPFVPLWQIDRHIVISTAVKVYFDGRADEINPQWIDPIVLFHSVARWRLE